MKKILIIFLLLFCINVKADEVNIDKINSNYEDYLYIEVTSNDNLDKLSNFVNAKEILFKMLLACSIKEHSASVSLSTLGRLLQIRLKSLTAEL